MSLNYIGINMCTSNLLLRQYLPCCKQGVSVHCKSSVALKYLDQLASAKYSCYSGESLNI